MDFSIFNLSSLLVFLLPSLYFVTSLFIQRVWHRCRCDSCHTFLSGTWRNNFHNLCDWHTHLLRTSPTLTIHIHLLRNIITAHPANVEHILSTSFHNYPKGRHFSAILGDFLGRGIFNVDGDLWRFQRKLAASELGSTATRNHAFEVVNFEIHTTLLPLLNSAATTGRVLDLQQVLRSFSFDCVCKFSFGLEPGFLHRYTEFTAAFDLASQLSAERAMLPSPLLWKMKRMMNMGSEKKLRDAINVISILAIDIIEQKRLRGFSGQRDFLSRLMQTVDDDKYLRDIIVNFLLAGRDSVAAALTSFFWLLACHREVELTIRLEVERVVVGRGEGSATRWEDMKELHYLEAAIHEGMRLYPPVQFDSKFCEKDDVLPDGTWVRKGTRVTYHPYAMGRMERIWGADCMEFRPERWLKNGVFQPENAFKYPVFQGGVRVCVGKEIAFMEMKAVAVSLLRRFQIEVWPPVGRRDDEGGLRFAPGLTATLQHGLPVRIRFVEESVRAQQKTNPILQHTRILKTKESSPLPL